jgi:hypothetical protein
MTLAACGGGGDDDAADVASLGTGEEPVTTDPQSAASKDPEEAMLAFTECMRDHGVDMPDPVFDQGGRVEIGPGDEVGGDMSSDEFEAANEACRDEDGPDFAIAEEARP